MTVAEWPTELGKPQRQGYGRTLGEGRKFISSERGPGRIRRKFSSTVQPISMQIFLNTDDKKARFERFWNENTSGGSSIFTMADPETDGIPLLDEDGLPLLDEDDLPLLLSSTWVCQFGRSPPEVVSDGGRTWMITFPLVVLP